jgi:hypothetical protein
MDTSFTHVGRKSIGNNAGLRKSSGNVMTPPIAKTVSELLVFIPNASEIPDHASPKNASVKKMPRIPRTPVVTEAPKAYAKPKIMAVWITTLKASLVSLPNRIAGRLTGVTSIFCKKPVSMSATMLFPDCKALPKAFCSRIPAVANSR